MIKDMHYINHIIMVNISISMSCYNYLNKFVISSLNLFIQFNNPAW